MPDIVWFVGVVVALVAALLALDWFTAGRAKRRILVRSKDQSSSNANVGYAAVESNLQAQKYEGGAGY